MAQMTGAVGYRRLLLSLSICSAICVGFIQTPLPPPGLEAPHRLSTRLHISQMLHPPIAPLLFSLALSSALHPPYAASLCFPLYVERQAHNCLFPSNLPLTVCLSTCCSPHSGETRLGYTPQSQSRGLGMRMMGRGDRSFVGVKTHDPWVCR